mmetsp:Transcript_101483/g.315642  ORF Transcript_101483/g.315642 Transcript_101483/m.315642 type:complete len:100 (+) Transcript_101483:871-1170(+)
MPPPARAGKKQQIGLPLTLERFHDVHYAASALQCEVHHGGPDALGRCAARISRAKAKTSYTCAQAHRAWHARPNSRSRSRDGDLGSTSTPSCCTGQPGG